MELGGPAALGAKELRLGSFGWLPRVSIRARPRQEADKAETDAEIGKFPRAFQVQILRDEDKYTRRDGRER
jgi:hypothetical protein